MWEFWNCLHFMKSDCIGHTGLYRFVIAMQYKKYTLHQGCPNSVLEGHRPGCLRCFPASAHLIQINGS